MDGTEKYARRYTQLLDNYIIEVRERFQDVAAYCQSPIESALLAELQFMGSGYGDGGGCLLFTPVSELKDFSYIFGGLPDMSLAAMPQAKWGNYRIDIAIFGQGPARNGQLCMAVECDGHDFHEKTKSQAARDKARDRALTAGGWHVFHFTGSEIYADAEKCAIELTTFASLWMEKQIDIHLDALRKAK